SWQCAVAVAGVRCGSTGKSHCGYRSLFPGGHQSNESILYARRGVDQPEPALLSPPAAVGPRQTRLIGWLNVLANMSLFAGLATEPKRLQSCGVARGDRHRCYAGRLDSSEPHAGQTSGRDGGLLEQLETIL